MIAIRSWKFVTYIMGFAVLLVGQQAYADVAKRSTSLLVTHIASTSKPSTLTKPANLQKQRTLRVLSFNLAHGSNNPFGIVPWLARTSTIKRRLRMVARFLRKTKADVVGFQEADGPSWWSGRFHHVNFLARLAGYSYAGLGIHVNTNSKRYGTALISRLPLRHAISYRFKPLTMFKKGFVIASIAWPTRPARLVDVVSLHLDPQDELVQSSQLEELVRVLKKRKRPAIVMGDFNTVWNGGISPLNILTEKLKLRTYQQQNPHLYTHRFPSKRRIDWIYVSPQLRFVRYRVLRKRLTDHYPVMADIAFRDTLPVRVQRKTKPTPRTKEHVQSTPPTPRPKNAGNRPTTNRYSYWISLPSRKAPTTRPSAKQVSKQ